ncbi:unnamed protein product [Laminaria digitata]
MWACSLASPLPHVFFRGAREFCFLSDACPGRYSNIMTKPVCDGKTWRCLKHVDFVTCSRPSRPGGVILRSVLIGRLDFTKRVDWRRDLTELSDWPFRARIHPESAWSFLVGRTKARMNDRCSMLPKSSLSQRAVRHVEANMLVGVTLAP